jgi:hypothetical protein
LGAKDLDRLIGGIAVTYRRNAVLGLAGAIATIGVGTFGAPASAAVKAPLPTDPADVNIHSAAACVGPNAVVTGEMLVDGNPVTFGDGKILVQGGSTVTVNFTVSGNCGATKFGLAAYSDPVGSADPTYQDVEKQTYATSQTVTKSAGQSGTLTVTLPAIHDCFYQVDFFTGDVLTTFSTNNYYGFPDYRLISVTHVQKPNCVEVQETSTTMRPTTTTTPSSTSTSVHVGVNEVPSTTTTTTEAPAEVLDTELSATTSTSEATTSTTQPAQVLAEELARTGGNQLGLASMAGAFALAGGSFRVAANALRRRRS